MIEHPHNKEAAWFWRWSSALQAARRKCAPGETSEEIDDCLSELASLAHHAHSDAVRAKCFALLAPEHATAEDASA